MTATDRVAPEPGQCTVFVGPGPGQRPVAGKEAENIHFPDSVAVDVATDVPAELMQQIMRLR